MTECPDIKECTIERTKESFQFFCLQNWKICGHKTVRKKPKEWLKKLRGK